jgi:hypothetical protein
MKINKEDNSEIQLFVIWSKGRYAETDILADIATKFEIIQTFSITWSPYMVHQNFTRFYDTKLPRNSQKEIYAGAEEFKLIIVRDNEPRYDYRTTSKGKFVVNTKMFDAKAKYRELTGGGHKIHGTNDKLELKHDLVMLLGLSLNDFLKKYDKPNEDNIDIALTQDLPGTIGWKSFDELFYVLNECDEYVVLRNSDNISLQYYQKNKGDIDLLVKDRNRCQYLLGDLSCIDSEVNIDSKVSIDNKVILFELYEAGHNLFENNYELHLFNNRVSKGNMYCLPKELEFYTLIYHALVFHKNLSHKHTDRISELIKEQNKLQNLEINQNNLAKILKLFFKKNGFAFVPPNNSAILFNYNLFKDEVNFIKNKKRSSKLKSNLKKIIRFDSYNKYMKITFLSFLNNEIDLVFSFRFRFLIKEIRFCFGNRRKYKY